MLVVGFGRNSIRVRLCRHQFYFVNQIPTPRLVDPRADLALHLFELLSPRPSIRGDFKKPGCAPDRPRVRRECLSDYARP
jgi:hypothetical protein